ncbi:unnamed protein product [Brassica oleracea var. botrytis]|uniref:DOMON domain-containing protein n=1 Tax=Brassica oleracea TaxID=3712 RepID=A0A3P6GAH1_BRAOL|nr:unnamed protein product [Brassica oleracea]
MWLTPFANSYLLHANLESSTWIAWAINTTSKDMLGAQALVAYRNSKSSVMLAYISSINNYATIYASRMSSQLLCNASDDNNTSTSSRHEENDMSSTVQVETTEMAAEKKSQFPPSRRRKLKSDDKSLKDAYL